MTPDESDDNGAEDSTDEETEAESEAAEETTEEQQATGQGQAAGASAGGFLGTPEESNLIKEWITFVTALLAAAGAGIGISFFLYGTIEEPIYSYDISTQFGSSSASAVGMDLIAMNIGGLGVFAGALLGAYLGWKLDVADDLAFKAAALSSAVGTLALTFLAGFFLSLGVENLDIEFGGLLINSIVLAIVAGLIGAAGVWIARNQAPHSAGQDVDSPGPGPIDPTD